MLAEATEADGLTSSQAGFLKRTLTGLNAGHVALSRDAFDGTVRHWPSSGKMTAETPLFATSIATAVGSKRGRSSGRITYYTDPDGKPFTFPTYPAHAAKLLPPQWFKDKIILIGATLPNIDQHQTPFTTASGISAGAVYGVKIHAHMIAQILRNDAVTQAGSIAKILICLILAGLIALALHTISSLPSRLIFIGLVLGGLIVLTLTLYRAIALAGC